MRRIAITHAILAICIIIPHSPANSEQTANFFLKRIDTEDARYSLALEHYRNGMAWANSYLKVKGETELYCEPGKLAMTPEQNTDILRRHVKDHPADGNLPAGAALLMAYVATFP